MLNMTGLIIVTTFTEAESWRHTLSISPPSSACRASAGPHATPSLPLTAWSLRKRPWTLRLILACSMIEPQLLGWAV